MTPPALSGSAAAAVADAHRREWAAVLAATVRVAGDLDLAEECVQEAYAAALVAWARDGVPRSPAAWLTTTARNRAVDAHRRAAVLRSKLPLLMEPEMTPEVAPVFPDDRLRLVFTCCHPALAREAQVGLTLRLLCGMTTAEVARAFLVSEATMAARVTRAKKKIAAARIPYRVPQAHELPDRLDAVLTVVHLLFTTGHTAPVGDDLVRADLVERALDLARTLAGLMPDEAEVRGLLALMLLTDARRATRTDAAGNVVLLADQDRSRWDAAALEEGAALVVGELSSRRAGRFALQAAIAAVHARAPSWQETDWLRVVRLYDELHRQWPSPVVELNRAAAVAMAEGPAAGLAAVDALAGQEQLRRYHYLPALRADLLRRLGRVEEAASAYADALALADNAAERRFLQGRLAALPVAGAPSEHHVHHHTPDPDAARPAAAQRGR